MKKLLRLVLAVLVVLALATGLIVYLTTRVPDAEPAETVEREPDARINASDRAMVESLAGLFGIDPRSAETTYALLREVVARGEVDVSAVDLADVVTAALSGTPDGRAVLEAAGPVRVRYDGDRVEIGARVDLRELDTDRMSADARDLAERLRRYVPFLAKRPVWVAFDSAPIARDGHIDLGSDVALRLGSLHLPGFLARPLGLDQRLRETLLLDLRFLIVDAVEVRGDRLHLEARPAFGAP